MTETLSLTHGVGQRLGQRVDDAYALQHALAAGNLFGCWVGEGCWLACHAECARAHSPPNKTRSPNLEGLAVTRITARRDDAEVERLRRFVSVCVCRGERAFCNCRRRRRHRAHTRTSKLAHARAVAPMLAANLGATSTTRMSSSSSGSELASCCAGTLCIGMQGQCGLLALRPRRCARRPPFNASIMFNGVAAPAWPCLLLVCAHAS